MATEKPNVLLILADDIGWFDVGAYHRGIMGCRTPGYLTAQHGKNHLGDRNEFLPTVHGFDDSPRGGDRERSYDPQLPHVRIPRKVMKGGSHLCSQNYCRRYRPAARMPQPIDTSTSHLGFRCIVRP
jgi:arylsulfatase A-like enzyme